MEERLLQAMEDKSPVKIYFKDSSGVVIGTVYRVNPVDVEILDSFDRLFIIPSSSILAVQVLEMTS